MPRDSVNMTLFSWFVAQNSIAAMVLPGRLDSALAQSLSGPATVGPGTTGSWSVSVPGDTISYAYAWKIDGQLVGGAARNILGTSWQTVGSHVLSVTTTRSDFSTTVSTKTVGVVFSSSIAGKSTTKRPCDLVYTSSVTGGVGSLTRVWKLDGTTIQSGGSSLALTVDWLGTKTLSTQITDGVGNVSNATFGITGTSTGQCVL